VTPQPERLTTNLDARQAVTTPKSDCLEKDLLDGNQNANTGMMPLECHVLGQLMSRDIMGYDVTQATDANASFESSIQFTKSINID
jgi:hypothetical protein